MKESTGQRVIFHAENDTVKFDLLEKKFSVSVCYGDFIKIK